MERQDSLSNRIQDVLGDMGTVHHVIGRDPNVWLGTSRNASTSVHTTKNYSADKARTYKDGENNALRRSITNTTCTFEANYFGANECFNAYFDVDL